MKIESNDNARDVILSYCQENGIDLVVVGRSNSLVDHMILGSTSSYLLSHSKIPVLIAKHKPIEIEK